MLRVAYGSPVSEGAHEIVDPAALAFARSNALSGIAVTGAGAPVASADGAFDEDDVSSSQPGGLLSVPGFGMRRSSFLSITQISRQRLPAGDFNGEKLNAPERSRLDGLRPNAWGKGGIATTLISLAFVRNLLDRDAASIKGQANSSKPTPQSLERRRRRPKIRVAPSSETPPGHGPDIIPVADRLDLC